MHKPLITVGIICEHDSCFQSSLIEIFFRGDKKFKFDILVAGVFSSQFESQIFSVLPEARLYKLAPASKPICRQVILDNSHSEYILFCLDGYIIDEETINAMFEELITTPNVGVVVAQAGGHSKDVESRKWDCALAMRSALTMAGGFPVELSPLALMEDEIMQSRLKSAGYDELVSSKIVVPCPSSMPAIAKDTRNLLFRKHDLEFCQNELEILQEEGKIDKRLSNGERKIKVLLMYDQVGWAWWHRSNNIKKCISPRFQVDIMQWHQTYDEDAYDFIVCFDAYFYNRLRQPVKDWRKLIVGCSAGKLIEATRHICSLLPHVGVIANSYAAYDALKSDLNVFCCQNGVDGELFYPPKELPEKFFAGWVGNPKSLGQKGLDIIELACKAANVPLIVSNKELGDSYSHEELRDNIYHKASVYLCASEAEGTPNPALEAMACGLPVISTHVGNMVEMIVDGYNGYLVERDIRSFVQGLKRLKKLNQQELCANARWVIENGWLWKEQVRKYEAMFERLIGKRGN